MQFFADFCTTQKERFFVDGTFLKNCAKTIFIQLINEQKETNDEDLGSLLDKIKEFKH